MPADDAEPAPSRESHEAYASQDSRSRFAGLLLTAAWIVPCGMSLLSDQATPRGRYAGNIASLLFAPLFVVLAIALGDWLLSRVVRAKDAFAGRWLFAAGLGFGAFSLGTLLVGLIIIPPAFVSWIILIALSALLSSRIGGLLLALRGRVAAFVKSRNWAEMLLVLIIGVLLLLNVLRAFVPPIEYDEMEYHLAAPAKYVRGGRISFISDNAYASFPANVEMLFLDAMVIRGGVVDGFALGRLINVSLGLLAACAAGACAAAMFTKRAAIPAAAILYTWPRVNSLSHVGYVELGLMLYVALALLAAYQYRKAVRSENSEPGTRNSKPGTRNSELGTRNSELVVLGLVCGLAAGCKYPAVLFVCVPAAVWVLATAGRKLMLHGPLFAALALAVLSPWLIRNTVNTGNPVYPLLGGVLKSPAWSARKEARWHKAHQPYDHLRPASRAVWKAVVHRYPDKIQTAQGEKPGPYAMSLLLVVFIPLAFVGRGRAVKTGVLLALALFCIAAWLALTHRIPRFLVPWLVPLVIVNAAGAAAFANWKIPRVALSIVLIVLAGVEAWATIRVRAPGTELGLFAGQYGIGEAVGVLKAGSTYNHDAVIFINKLPRGSRTLFYGEAQTLYCTGDVIAPTVFDENPLDEIVRTAKSADDIGRGLKRLGVTHIYVNLDELHRLQWSYAFEHEGGMRHGYSSFLGGEPKRSHLPRFLATHCRVIHPELPPGLPQRALRALDRAFVEQMSHHDRGRRTGAPIGHFIYELRRP